MRHITLSDHPATKLQQRKAKREQQYLSDLTEHKKLANQLLSEHAEKTMNYEADMRAWQRKISKLKSKRLHALSRLNVCQAVIYSRTISQVSKAMLLKPKPPLIPQPYNGDVQR